jgi:hypothetical protein
MLRAGYVGIEVKVKVRISPSKRKPGKTSRIIFQIFGGERLKPFWLIVSGAISAINPPIRVR